MGDLVGCGIMSKANYSALVNRGRIEVVRRGGGANKYALVAVDSLPKRFLDKIKPLAISPFAKWINENYILNQRALAFYLDSNICGKRINCSMAMTLAINASILDCIMNIFQHSRLENSIFGGRIDWCIICEFLRNNKSHYGHTLPLSSPRLMGKFRLYQKYGFSALISQKFGNQNARK